MNFGFGLTNWLVLILFLFAFTWLGYRMSNKSGNLDDFFLGGR